MKLQRVYDEYKVKRCIAIISFDNHPCQLYCWLLPFLLSKLRSLLLLLERIHEVESGCAIKLGTNLVFVVRGEEEEILGPSQIEGVDNLLTQTTMCPWGCELQALSLQNRRAIHELHLCICLFCFACGEIFIQISPSPSLSLSFSLCIHVCHVIWSIYI